jgi:hypothetical protein
MKTQILATVGAAALSVVLALTAAYSQAPQDGVAPSAPAAQPSGPGDRGPGVKSEGRGAASDQLSGEKMGARSKEPNDTADRDRKASTDEKAGGKSAEGEGKEDRDAKDHDRNRKSADSKDEIDRKSVKTEDKDRIDRDRKSVETGDRDRMDRDRKSAESGDTDRTDRDRKSGNRTTVKIDTNQKEKVRSYFSEHRPSAKRVDRDDVHVSIGIGIPAGIVLAPLPPDIVVVAADCPLQYFLWGDDVVLVDSCSREVVDIIPNIG